jgi:hypothetical protein
MRLALVFSSVVALALISPVARAQDLAPPPPIQQNGPGSQPAPSNEELQKQDTNRKLNEAESADSGRNFELIWADFQAGGTYIDMAQFSASDLAVRQTKAGGPSFSLGAGIRLVIFYAGLRARYNVLSMFNLWNLNVEAGIKIPISALDFMIGAHGGYSFVGSLADSNQATDTSTPTKNDAVSIRGFNVGADVALDYYINSYFSVGVGVLGDVLLLNRPPVDKPKGLTAEQQAKVDADPLYQKSGTSAGLGAGGMLRLGLHLGL